MDDTQQKLQHEVRELRAEVQRLKRSIQGGLAVAGLVVLCVFPQLALMLAEVGASILFALLISPVRHLIFPTVFRAPRNRKS